jgi:LPXTG-motif cell wall-anchored protein
VFIPITLSQQQQQQQQGGGGGGGGSPQQQQGHGGSGGGQQQQQQQQQQAPIIRDVASSILPRTGADAKRIGAWGAGLLAVGLLLVGWSRRRRRAAQSRALAELPPIDAVIVEPEGSWEPGMPHPSEFLSEADGVPPVYLPWPERLYLPAPEDHDDEDVLTPSF